MRAAASFISNVCLTMTSACSLTRVIFSQKLRFAMTCRAGAILRSDDITSERADIVDWSTPLIADCLGLAYRACLGGDSVLVEQFTRQHRRLWTSLVADHPARAIEARKTLSTLAKLCQLNDEALHAIDELVLDELTDVVSHRFQGSPAKTRTYSKILINAASVLTRSRLAAA